MRFLVIGSGGREHAIIRKLRESPAVTDVHCAPGNGLITSLATCHPAIAATDIAGILGLVDDIKADVVFVGPEDPLVFGLSDRLRAAGVPVVGPSQRGAMLEGSKAFCKEFLVDAGVPTAGYGNVDSVDSTMALAAKYQAPYVLKADGLAAGKGVVICATLEELRRNAELYFEKKIFGKAGKTAVFEEFLDGYEISFLALTNGETFVSLPVAQDHKRLREGDQGPNTGGMGTIAPIDLGAEVVRQIEETIVAPTVRALAKKGIVYRGVLFFGIMVTRQGPQVIEINCRFGDPETQVLLPLITSDFALVMRELADGKLDRIEFARDRHAACIVLAAPGYPDQPRKGLPIEGKLEASQVSAHDTAYWLGAGVQRDSSGALLVSGGRVLNSVALGGSRQEALMRAYEQLPQARFEGMQFRKDIGFRA